MVRILARLMPARRGRFGVAADGVHVAAELGAPEQERPRGEHAEHDQHDPRHALDRYEPTAVGVADQHEHDPGDAEAGDLQHGQAGRRRDQAARAPARLVHPRSYAEQTDDHDHDDPARGRSEVAAREVVDDLVVDRERSALAEDQEHHALPAEQAGQGHDERRQPDPGDDRALDRADRRAGEQRDDASRPTTASRTTASPTRR